MKWNCPEVNITSPPLKIAQYMLSGTGLMAGHYLSHRWPRPLSLHCFTKPKLLSRLAFSYSYTCVALYVTNFVLFVFVIYCLFVLFCVIHWFYVNMVTRTIRYTVPCLKCILLDTYNKIAVSSYVVGICWIYHWNISNLYNDNEIAAITSWAI